MQLVAPRWTVQSISITLDSPLMFLSSKCSLSLSQAAVVLIFHYSFTFSRTSYVWNHIPLPPQPNPPPSPASTLPLDFVHVSFIAVPENPSPHCPFPPPLWLLLEFS